MVVDQYAQTSSTTRVPLTEDCNYKVHISRGKQPTVHRGIMSNLRSTIYNLVLFLLLSSLPTAIATSYATPGGALPPQSAYIRCDSNGLYWTRNAGALITCNATSISTADVFLLASYSYGTSIKDASLGQYVSCNAGNGASQIIANRGSPDTWEV